VITVLQMELRQDYQSKCDTFLWKLENVDEYDTEFGQEGNSPIIRLVNVDWIYQIKEFQLQSRMIVKRSISAFEMTLVL
jgi:hypothetical protein